jgi:hypothetical protein
MSASSEYDFSAIFKALCDVLREPHWGAAVGIA